MFSSHNNFEMSKYHPYAQINIAYAYCKDLNRDLLDWFAILTNNHAYRDGIKNTSLDALSKGLIFTDIDHSVWLYESPYSKMLKILACMAKDTNELSEFMYNKALEILKDLLSLRIRKQVMENLRNNCRNYITIHSNHIKSAEFFYHLAELILQLTLFQYYTSVRIDYMQKTGIQNVTDESLDACLHDILRWTNFMNNYLEEMLLYRSPDTELSNESIRECFELEECFKNAKIKIEDILNLQIKLPKVMLVKEGQQKNSKSGFASLPDDIISKNILFTFFSLPVVTNPSPVNHGVVMRNNYLKL